MAYISAAYTVSGGVDSSTSAGQSCTADTCGTHTWDAQTHAEQLEL
jgi:hypothetical protein